jgi:crotonobetainyl-CoA:carnitine CoA-transferase CaiB-like acyl-CoA transferase
VLSLPEALQAAEERGMVVRPDGVPQVAAAPRLSETPAVVRATGPRPGEHDAEIREQLARDAAWPRQEGCGS